MVIHVPEEDRDHLDQEFMDSGVVAIDFRETSPEGSEKEMYEVEKAGQMAAAVGGLAVGVPGELRGLQIGEEGVPLERREQPKKADPTQLTRCTANYLGRR